ncbi:hypothetical protein GCM10009639_14950 [Kitasatospora putterlickiae]|uniref:Uncharacterized protein n=1 Tax=Kitasatospora putterlickiae TaxID=221725 RepID=A0ABN1XRQ0_9ACTN
MHGLRLQPLPALVAHHLLQVTVDHSAYGARFRFPPLTRLDFAPAARPRLQLAD